METSSRSISRRSAAILAVVLLVGAYVPFSSRGTTVTAQTGSELQGLGTVTGTVTAGKPFKAAQVFIRSNDQRRKCCTWSTRARCVQSRRAVSRELRDLRGGQGPRIGSAQLVVKARRQSG